MELWEVDGPGQQDPCEEQETENEVGDVSDPVIEKQVGPTQGESDPTDVPDGVGDLDPSPIFTVSSHITLPLPTPRPRQVGSPVFVK